MNSIAVGLSKIITMGNEWQVTAPDYMRWLAADETTSVVGVVLESIKDPSDFAAACRLLRGAGKGLAVLKVGRSSRRRRRGARPHRGDDQRQRRV